MSDRYALTQQRALQTQLDLILRRLDAMERRQRWNGAVQFVEQSGSWSLTTGSPVEVLSVSCEPGRWTFIGHAVIEASVGTYGSTTVTATPPLVTITAGLRAAAADLWATSQVSLQSAVYSYAVQSAVVLAAATFTTQTSVSLRLNRTASSGTHAAAVTAQSIIAIAC